MDINDIRRKAEAAREFAVAVGALQFTLRLPTQHEVEVEVSRRRLHEGAEDPALLLRIRRALVEAAVVSWAGVTCEHLAPGGGTDAAELMPGAVALLLDAQPEVADALFAAFMQQRAERSARQEAAAKN